MIVGFSTMKEGNKTYFPEKVLASIDPKQVIDFYHKIHKTEFTDSWALFNYEFDYSLYLESLSQPKIHTFRGDSSNRFRQGLNIDYFINVRTKNMFRFAPKQPLVSTQNISIIYYKESNVPIITIDNIELVSSKIEELAINDGFNSVEHFLSWFKEDFSGKIIHWTGKKY